MSWDGIWSGADESGPVTINVVVAAGESLVETRDAVATASPDSVAIAEPDAIATATSATGAQ